MDRKTREALLVAKNVTGRALGGRTPFGLKSKAAEVARSLPQEKGSVDQMVAMLRKAGVKPAEIEHAGIPQGKMITREGLARHFEANVPKIKVSQYGEQPSNPENKGIVRRLNDIGLNYHNATPEQRAEYEALSRRTHSPNVFETDEDEPEIEGTKYEDYSLPGGRDYRERLIHLPASKNEKAYRVQAFNGGDLRQFSSREEAKAYADELERRDGGERAYMREFDTLNKADFLGNHWDTSNVLAHIRMTDRVAGEDRESVRPIAQKLADHYKFFTADTLMTNDVDRGVGDGVISPEEAASLARVMKLPYSKHFARPGIGKRILHVEEIQSDWAQGGRESGFHDPKNPYEIFRTDTGETVSKHPSHEEMWDAFRAMPDEQSRGLDYGHAKSKGSLPSAPYVQNTQHWTDLALKNVLFEAANGGYDHVVFSPGQANADRYGLEKHVDGVHYEPETKSLYADKGGSKVFQQADVEPKDVASYIGKEAAERLLHPDNSYTVGNTLKHSLIGDDLKVGGQGMKGYYDNILPKSVTRLAQQHDPEITSGTMELPGTEAGQTYQGFSIPVTDKLKQGILKDGQNYFQRGGRVGYNVGGYVPPANLPVGRLRTAIPHTSAPAPAMGATLDSLAGFGKTAAGIAAALTGKEPEQQAEAAGRPQQRPEQAAVQPQAFSIDDNMRERLAYGITSTAEHLGMDPVDLATIISYETAGTFDPMKTGPTTKWGTHRGLIQFGEPQAKEYGVDWSDPLGSQLGPDGAVARYFQSRGWKPEMGILDAYSIVNAGSPGRYNASDTAAGGAPGTVADKVRDQFAPHRAKAAYLLQQRQPGQAYASGGSVGGDLEKARAREAVERAGGQIAPSKYLPDVPRAVHADGGEVTGMGDNGGPPLSDPPVDLGAAREQKQVRDFHKGMMGDIRSGMSNLMQAHQKAVDAGAFEGYGVGDMLKGSAGPMKIENMFVRKWKPNSLMSRHFDRMNVAPTIIEHEGDAYVPMVRYITGREDDPDWQRGDAYMDMIRAAGYPKMGGLRAVKAAGGAVDGMEAFYRDMHPDMMGEQGKPMDLYHGTPGEPFEAFDDKKIGQRDAGFYGRGHYLTTSPDAADDYAYHGSTTGTGSVMGPLHAALKNPFVWDLSDEAKADQTKRKLTELGVMKWHDGPLRSWDNLQHWETDKFTKAAMDAGHDGVIMKTDDGPKEIVVFDPRKVKHATENSGAFDTTNPNIYKASGGPVDGDPQATPGASPARPQAGEFPVAGGLGGGSGVLPAQGEASLEGLPQRVKVPLTGEVIQAGADPRIRQVARDYMASSGLPYNPPTKYAKVDPARSKRIAAAYDAMPDEPDHPLVQSSYAQMIKETMDQYRAAKAAGFKAEFWNPATDKDPYEASPRLAVEDVRKNHHMYVYPTSAGYGTGQEITEDDIRKNPMLADSGERWNGVPATVNDIFRAVHDYYGHAKEGVGFRADGEENAWRAHASMFSPLARMAMTAETRGQNSWLNYGPHGESNRNARTEDTVFAPQKIGILPHWAHHDGAEDFITPESRQQMAEIMRKHGKLENDVVGDALKATRGAFRDGGAPGFFSKEAGQARRQALNEAVSSLIPPGLRPAAGALGSMTPIAGLERSGQATQQAFDPSLSAGQRAASGATAVAEALGVAAPLAMAGRAAMPAAQIAREVLAGGYTPDFGKDWEDVYHYTRANQMPARLDPDMSREAFSRIGPHVGTMRAAQDRAAAFSEPSQVGIMPLRADTSRPFVNPSTGEPFREVEIQSLIRAVADDHGVDLKDAATIMRDRLAQQGYTSVPYVNDMENAGSISHVMLTKRPETSNAVLRHRDAAFSPRRATSPNLMASAVPAALGATGYAAYGTDDYSGSPR